MTDQISRPGFLIDLDGLLINSESMSQIAFERMCRLYGCSLTDDYLTSIRGMKESQWSENFVINFKLDISGVEVADTHAKLFLEEMDQGSALLPGASELLHWLDEKGYPKCLVTSADLPYVTSYLLKHGIRDSFAHMVTAEDVQNGKPDPEPYLLGAKRIEREPHACIVLEDSVNGMLSGKAAGSTVVGVPSPGCADPGQGVADYIVPSLNEALVLLIEMGL